MVLEPGDAQVLLQAAFVVLAFWDFGLFLLDAVSVIGVKHCERVLAPFVGEAFITGDGLFHFQHSRIWVHFSHAS